MSQLLQLRLRKLWTALTRPACWRALRHGVAPSVEHGAVLRDLRIDGIIDVGANRGQFTLLMRLLFPRLPVVAFEPIPAEAARFRAVHGRVPQVRLVQSALGEEPGEATLHLSASADSSSLLPIGRRQTELFKHTGEVGTIVVPIQRLDSFSSAWNGCSRLLLKADVQGFELPVLRGGIETLRACAYVYLECSEVALYEGQALRTEVESFLKGHGFRPAGRFNELTDRGELIQADYLFERPL